MTRTDLLESMARAAWEKAGEPEPWEGLPSSMRRDWMHYQLAALEALEELSPAVRDKIAELTRDS
jgi:hypothetical protein